MVFAREISDPVTSLVKKIDAATVKNSSSRMGSFAVFLSDQEGLDKKLKDDSDNALKAYESELAAARARAQAISTETREKLNAVAEAERKSLEDKLSVKLAEAEKTIAATREGAMRNVRGIAADAASAIVQRLTGVVPDGKAVATAVDRSLKG